MGMIIKEIDVSPNLGVLIKPIIYCHPQTQIVQQAISINKSIAEQLLKYQPDRRTMKIDTCFSTSVATLPDNTIIKDFDVIFNPSYRIDILKMMIIICKNKPFSVIWPGRYDNGKLYYAEEGYSDYKIYDIDDYDVTCVI